jgi:uncharacterized protein (TIRG00374 family)
MPRLLTAIRSVAGSLAFRAIVTVLLLGLVFRRLDWTSISDKVEHGDLVAGALAVVCVAGALVIGAVRWDRLLRLADISLPKREIFRIYAVSSFANAFLPTSVGGDVARPLMVSRSRSLLVRAASTVIVERLVALVALLALACVGLVLAPHDISRGSTGAVVVATLGLVGVLGSIAVFPRPFARLARTITPARFSEELEDAVAVVRAILASPVALLTILVESIAFQALVTMQLVLLGRMIGAELSFGLAAVALALVTLATLLPISIGGFGVREGSYAVILAAGGISHTDAVLISLLTVVVLFLATLPGAGELVRRGFSPAVEGPAKS